MLNKSWLSNWGMLKPLSGVERGLVFGVLIHLILLLLLGKTYTKTVVYSQLHLHDMVLVGLFAFSLLFKSTWRIKGIEILIGASLVYLVLSYVFQLNELQMNHLYIRQFMIFGYLALTYFVVKAIIKLPNGSTILVRIILLIAFLSIVFQLIHVFNIYSKSGSIPFFKRRYFTPLTILGLLTLGAYSLVYLKKWYKYLFFAFLLIVSFTFGHDSAYLAMLLIILAYLLLKSTKWIKIFVIVLAGVSIALLFLYVDTFSDVNMYWRIICWREILLEMCSNGSVFYGKGFGVPYIEPETIEKLNQIVVNGQQGIQISMDPLRGYVVAPHNSFLSMVIHLGLGSLILMIWPLKKLFSTDFRNSQPEILFLTLALIGGCVWSFFNVILELPHSSIYFWIIYFTLIFFLNNRKTQKDIIHIKTSFSRLKEYCEKENFKGWDPYDGLNSWVIQKTFLGKSAFFKLAWIQLFKRNPINLRTLFGVKKEHNAKGLGLFLLGYCKLYYAESTQENYNKIVYLSDLLVNMRNVQYSGACWGYNFDWQARAFFQPKGTPTVVATSFVVEALLEAYQITNNESYLNTAISAKDFVLKDLNKTYDAEGNYTVSYSPLDNTAVFNAGLLGAKLLSLIYSFTKDESLLTEAKKIVQFVCAKQQPNGAWAYGTLPFHQWVDNFHTGFNLECIYYYQKISNDTIFSQNISLGLKYYLETFFTEEGVSKYYNDKTFPVDIHAPAQLIVTMCKMDILEKNKGLADQVLLWTISNMQSNRGYFYYQKKNLITTKTPYMRWAQAWMFYALSYYTTSVIEEDV